MTKAEMKSKLKIGKKDHHVEFVFSEAIKVTFGYIKMFGIRNRLFEIQEGLN